MNSRQVFELGEHPSFLCKIGGHPCHSRGCDCGCSGPCTCSCHTEQCGDRWSAGGFEGDKPWDGLLCELPAGHDGWHETGICDPPVINGRITWMVSRGT